MFSIPWNFGLNQAQMGAIVHRFIRNLLGLKVIDSGAPSLRVNSPV
jgi:hypothetical protein